MATFTMEEIKEGTQCMAVYGDDGGTHFASIETDTRNIREGALFVALKGERFDGHDYVSVAREKGAFGAIVSEDRPSFHGEGFVIFVVKDTLVAYQDLARFHRRRFDIPVVAVTGSVGKTSTRNMVAQVLAQKYNVLQTEKNFNNEIGLPKTLLSLRDDHEVCVVEMGMRGLGQIAELAAIAEPTMGIVTNVGKSHIELLGSQENIAKAKCELVEALGPDGTAILNQDDPFVVAMADRCRGKVVGYGITSNAMVRGSRITCNEKGVRFTCRFFDQVMDISIPVIGEHNVYNALVAIAVGRILGLTEQQLQRGLVKYRGMAMRQELVNIGDYTFVNDAYNANPASMSESLRTLSLLTKGRKIAVLGGMLELGDWTKIEHEKIGKEAATLSLDGLITLGEPAQYIAEAAKKEGLSHVYTVSSHEEAAAVLQSIIQPGDTVLLKGSRGFAMEKILPYFERK